MGRPRPGDPSKHPLKENLSKAVSGPSHVSQLRSIVLWELCGDADIWTFEIFIAKPLQHYILTEDLVQPMSKDSGYNLFLSST